MVTDLGSIQVRTCVPADVDLRTAYGKDELEEMLHDTFLDPLISSPLQHVILIHYTQVSKNRRLKTLPRKQLNNTRKPFN